MSHLKNKCICPSCGEKNAGASHYCLICGARLEDFVKTEGRIEKKQAVTSNTDALPKPDAPRETDYAIPKEPAVEEDVQKTVSFDISANTEPMSTEQEQPQIEAVSTEPSLSETEELKVEPVRTEQEQPQVEAVSTEPSLSETEEPEVEPARTEQEQPQIEAVSTEPSLSETEELKVEPARTEQEQPKAEPMKVVTVASEDPITPVDEENAETVNPLTKKAEMRRKRISITEFFEKKRTKAFALIFISVTLLVFLFCPFVKVSSEYNETIKYDVTFTPFDFVGYASDSFVSDAWGMVNTSEYRAYRSLEKRVRDNQLRSPTRSNKAILAEYTETAISVSIMRDNITPKANLFASAGMTLIYVSALVLIALTSSLALIYETVFEKKEKESAALFSVAAKLLVLLVALLPVYTLLLLHAGHFTYGIPFVDFGNLGVSIGWGAVASLAVMTVPFIYMVVMVFRKIVTTEKSERLSLISLKIAAALCFLLAATSIFLPTFSVRFIALKNDEFEVNTIYVRPESVYELSSSDMEYLTSQSKSIVEDDMSRLIDQIAIKKTVDDTFSNQVLNVSLFANGTENSTLVTMIGSFEIISLAALIWSLRNALLLLIHKKKARLYKSVLTLTALSAVTYLALCIAAAYIATNSISQDIAIQMTFFAGLGPILTAALTAAAITCTLIRSHQNVKAEYDNPDASSAPYVI